MANFLIIAGTPVEILRDGATENESEFAGETVRAAAGNLVSTVRAMKRAWEFKSGPLLPADEEDLRAATKNDAQVTVSGDALGTAALVCIVRITGSDYLSDGTTDGFYRLVTMTVREV